MTKTPSPLPTPSNLWKKLGITTTITTLMLGGTTGYGFITKQQLEAHLVETENTHSTTKDSLMSELTTASTTIATLSTTIANLTASNTDLTNTLEAEQKKNDAFERQINKIAGTVGKLDKLSQTDKELLQKYSKVYFLNENYIPAKLGLISNNYVATGKGEMYFHASALPYLNRMIEAAEDDGVNLRIVSAYRSFETQADLKGAYLQSYGSGANTFSADQGYSEHQLGTTIDFATKETGSQIDGFGSTKAFTWLEKNGAGYGFVLSYPKGNSFYMYEPWHWRFVGTDLAQDLDDADAHFYDWEQRKIDAYLIKIFE